MMSWLDVTATQHDLVNPYHNAFGKVPLRS